MERQKESVVTAERFAKGMTYAEYVNSIERNQKRFEENYAGTAVPADEAARLKALMTRPGGPARIMVIGEDWCPDVFRGLPVFQRIAEATGMELRMFARDENKDIMAEFLNGGEHESIPVAVLYSKDMEYLGHFTERPQLAYQEMREKLGPMYEHLRKPDMTAAEKEAAKQENISFQNGPMWANWRQETIREVLNTLEARLA